LKHFINGGCVRVYSSSFSRLYMVPATTVQSGIDKIQQKNVITNAVNLLKFHAELCF